MRNAPAGITVELAPGIRAMPIVHGSVEFTVRLRQLFLKEPPALCAIELPENARPAIDRVLPFMNDIPILTFHTDALPLHIILEPLEPVVEALRSSHEANIPFHLIDRSPLDPFMWMQESFPDTYSLNFMTIAQMTALYRKHSQSPAAETMPPGFPDTDRMREVHMARRIRQLAAVTGGDNGGLLVVCGIGHIAALERLIGLNQEDFDREVTRHLQDEGGDEEPLEALLKQPKPEGDWQITVLSRESPEVLSQPGYYNAAWLIARGKENLTWHFNRIALQRSAYRESVSRYEREGGEIFPPQREKLFFQFARNWCWIENHIIPDAYRLVMAARGFGNDNFARLMYDVLSFLPRLRGSPFPEQKLTLDEMFKFSRLIRFRLKLKKKRRVPPPQLVRRFQREKYPGEWLEAFEPTGICSYPPEDITIEDFGRVLQKKAVHLMQSTENKTVPFTSSFLDGIDYRETIRSLHLGKVFVKDINTRGIEAGSVVIIFDDDPGEGEFDWRVVWWGEHTQESDMAFYATYPGLEVVGPGICRCRYGGLMMTYPPGRLHDIWTDEHYEAFTNPADRLLAAAIEYNEKNAVVHVAKKRPSPRLVQLAGRLGQKIVHIPVSTLNPVTLGRVRRFHVLDSKDRRDSAGDFIW